MRPALYANVIVDSDVPGISRTFTYRVPPELGDSVFEGACVAAPFGGRQVVGYVYDLTDTAPEIRDIKDISEVITEACAFNRKLLELADWIARRYVAPLGASMRSVVPEIMSATVTSLVRLVDPKQVHPSSPNQQKLVKALADLGGEADQGVLKMKAGLDKFGSALRRLRDRGAVAVVRVLELPKAKVRTVRGLKFAEDDELIDLEGLAIRAPRQAGLLREIQGSEGTVRQSVVLKKSGASYDTARRLVEKGLVEKVDIEVRRRPFADREVAPAPDFTLTKGQEDALEMIREGLDAGVPQTTLLYGVTGSGKTEVYLRSIARVLEDGKSAIALAPEIALTTHLMDAYRSHLGDEVAILHSKLSIGERYDEWRRIESGEARVVLGARSAIFAPVVDLGLVVIDEEHESSYKQDRSPRYNARDAAERRASEEGASVILGSATPSVESFFRASSGDVKLAVLEKRIEDRPLPTVEIVDLREEFGRGHRQVFSRRLQEAVEERLARKEQVILFVNRRGYASFVLCRTCGYVAECESCDVSLTFHTSPRMLRCHHCDDKKAAPTVCPNCGGAHIRPFGIGTERVEDEVRRVFPEAGVIRMDADTTRRKHAHAEMLDTFRAGRADILVGTQMVAKGLDFPNVTLVGVISADTGLNIPDFRAAERTFQLLTQVSGRAGRGKTPGETIIQSFSPDHYAIRAAARQDYLGFYGQEIGHRRELSYPPFASLVNIVSTDPVEGYAEERLRAFTRNLEGRVSGVDVIGPAPCPIARLRGLFRWHAILRNHRPDDVEAVSEAIKELLDALPPSDRADMIVDVDPLTML